MANGEYVEHYDSTEPPVVRRDAEEWRDDCLARWVLQLGRTDADRGLKRRQDWLRDYEKRHGREHTDKLKALIREENSRTVD